MFFLTLLSLLLSFSNPAHSESIQQELEKSVHTGFECTHCHPDFTAESVETNLEKVDCSSCHGDIAEEHSLGVHRVGKKKERDYATACTECHGTHHILPKIDKASPIHRDNIPLTCKKCHLGVFSHFSQSAHGELWKKGDPRGPVCTTCHKAHKIESISSTQFRTHLPEECGECHEDKAPTYKDTFHGQATSIGYVVAAKCSDCHTAHLNLTKEDPDSTVNPQNLMKTCGQCHPKANANFIQYDPHPNPKDKTKSPLLFYTHQLMGWLLTIVFLFFGIHTLLWFQRVVVALIRKEIQREWREDRYILRFDRQQRITHILIVLSFLGLAATGIPLKYHYAPWAKVVSTFFGGVEVARYFHRLCAIITGGYALYHLYYLFKQGVIKRSFKGIWFKGTTIPRLKDLTDLFKNLMWFLYLGERPKIGRWAYWEKFDYFAIFWGVPVIGISGLILWFPEFFTRFLPGSIINLSMIIHSEEALLAIGFIFIFHFFHTHLRPESFPMDPVIFTGRIPLDRFIEERPEEYEKLQRERKLEELLVGPPSKQVKTFAKIFGFSALATGIALIICIFVAFFGK